ncbi:MAG: 3,4-dihydroxy-2-butanone-4-phosphate synthase [Solitalea-like symbiont of Acarus siro]
MENKLISPIAQIIDDIKQGKIVIIIDDESRENEGDFVLAAQYADPSSVNFMAIHGKGLICVALAKSICQELNLPLMVDRNTSLHSTNFTVSVDLIGHGCTTGISAYDRSKTIQALVNDSTKPKDLARPGHIFPLIAAEGGLKARKGHTEASIELMKLAGLKQGAVICEIMNEDGSMARLSDLEHIAKKHHLKIISVQNILEYIND